MPTSLYVFCDGGARGNPGPAGIGVVIEREGKRGREQVAEISEYIGKTTNNQAEYRAVIRALEELLSNFQFPISQFQIVFFLDSELIIEQLKGNFRIKNLDLRTLNFKVQELIQRLGTQVTFRYVPRRQNKKADKLVNLAIDKARQG
jgi:ribonuclease HI